MTSVTTNAATSDDAETLHRAATKIRKEQDMEERLGHISDREYRTWLAVADWLDREAERYAHYEAMWAESHKDPRNRWEERGLTVKSNLEHHFRDPLAAARAYLGADA